MINKPTNARTALIPIVLKFSLKFTTVTRVESLFTTKWPFWKPMKATNKPRPTDTPFFNVNGIALKIASRTFVNDNTMKIKPSTNTASNATCHG